MNVENQDAPEPKPDKINARQEKFCQAYCRLLNGTQAYMEVYNPKGGLPVAGTNGFKLLQIAKIQNRIEEIRTFVAGKYNVTREEIIKLVSTVAKSDRRVLYDENGKLRDIKDLTYDEALQVDGIETLEEKDKDGNVWGYTKKVKVSDRTKSIEILNKMLGYNSPEKVDANVRGDLGGLLTIKVIPSEEQKDKTL